MAVLSDMYRSVSRAEQGVSTCNNLLHLHVHIVFLLKISLNENRKAMTLRLFALLLLCVAAFVSAPYPPEADDRLVLFSTAASVRRVVNGSTLNVEFSFGGRVSASSSWLSNTLLQMLLERKVGSDADPGLDLDLDS